MTIKTWASDPNMVPSGMAYTVYLSDSLAKSKQVDGWRVVFNVQKNPKKKDKKHPLIGWMFTGSKEYGPHRKVYLDEVFPMERFAN